MAEATTPEQIDQSLTDLTQCKGLLQRSTATERLALANGCLEGISRLSQAWVEACCQSKGLDQESRLVAEEITAGPMAILRYLQLARQVLQASDRRGNRALPRPRQSRQSDNPTVRVFPTTTPLFDSLLFPGFQAHVRLQPNHSATTPERPQLETTKDGPTVCLVLGAGNVSSIAPTDVLEKLLLERRAVLLKMNPVNAYLGALLEEAFQPLRQAGFLRICYGGADVGQYAIEHDLVDTIHITGSLASYEHIVWGSNAAERQRRRAAQDPRLRKPLSSELGNVTPWIVVPGQYRETELDFQAENVVAMLTNNGAFNCVAPRVIITCRGWPQEARFLQKIAALLTTIPPRTAYYPGALDRYRRFAGQEPPGDALPWTLLTDVHPDRKPHLFEEESFVCVMAATSLEAPDTASFLDRVADFANNRCWGTLGVGIMVPSSLRRSPTDNTAFQQLLARLRYGTVAINHWPGLAFAMMSSPWGGYPGGTLDNPQSGNGWVHNPYGLERVQKTVLSGPLVVRPKPLWFPTHRTPRLLAERVLQLYQCPAWRKLPAILLTAIRG